MAYVARTGALSPDALVIHAVEVDQTDIDLLAASGAAVAHCPRSNDRLRCAPAPVADILRAGITVGLGTDSLASNDSLDMFAEMRAALAAAQRRAVPGGSAAPRPLTPDQVLRMATLEGARALGWGSLTGSLEPGKSADLIAVRLPDSGDPAAASASPPDRSGLPVAPVEVLVERGTARDVLLTMVAGAVVFAVGASSGADWSGYRTAREKLGLRDQTPPRADH